MGLTDMTLPTPHLARLLRIANHPVKIWKHLISNYYKK